MSSEVVGESPVNRVQSGVLSQAEFSRLKRIQSTNCRFSGHILCILSPAESSHLKRRQPTIRQIFAHRDVGVSPTDSSHFKRISSTNRCFFAQAIRQVSVSSNVVDSPTNIAVKSQRRMSAIRQISALSCYQGRLPENVSNDFNMQKKIILTIIVPIIRNASMIFNGKQLERVFLLG